MSEAGPGAAAPSGEDSGGGALAPAAQERLQLAADVVDAAYAGLRPFYSNLLDDMGATDSFLICGHSLLLELLAGERLDWSHGGQFLQLRAALERFIAGINAANTTGLRYWVVLFDASAAVLPGAAAQAALALAASWLPALGVPTLRFSAWWGEDWRQWLERVRPSMLLLTDLPQGDPSGGAAAAASSAAQLQRARLFLQAAVVANQAQGVQCAFMSELRFMAEGHLFGFRTGWRSWVPSRRGTADRNALSAAAARDVGLAFERSAAEADGGSEGGALDAAALAQEIVGSAPPGRVRAALGAACCGLVAAQAAADGVPPTACQLYAQAWCLHELLLRRLSLQERALRLPEEPAGEAGGADGHSWQEVQRGLHTFLSAFHATAVAVLHSSSGSGSGATAAGGLACDGAGGSASGGASLALDASMADWVDGRLLHCVVQALWQGRPVGPLSPEEHVELQALLQQAAQHAASAGFAGGDSWAAALRQDAAPGKAGDVQHLLQQLLQPVPPQHVGSPAAEAGAPERRVLQENALVQAVVGSGGGVSAGLLLGLGAEEAGEYVEGSKAYDASFHWHSGKPIDATQMDVAAEELEVKQDLQAMTLEEVAACDALPPWVRRRAKFALEKIEFLLKGGFRNDAAKREKEAKKDLIQKVGATNRAWQTYYRHLEQYAKSLDATRFHHQPAGGKAGGGKGGGGGKGHAGQKQAGGVKKADLLRQKAAAERAAKAGDSAEEQWKLVRKGLEDRLDRSPWTAELAADVASLLSGLASKSPAVYLAAAKWRLQQLLGAWTVAARAAARATTASGSSSAGVGTSGDMQAQLVVDMWAAVADLVERGLLQAGNEGVPDKARQAAGGLCLEALRALGLRASEQHVAALLGSSGGAGGDGSSKKEGKKSGKGSKTGGDADGGGDAAGPGLGLSDARFQLRHCGHLLPHEAPPERDPRVESFNPDMWQRQVLDCIDDGASALVVAPTSSGKTFISSYCISSVVRRMDDPEGIVVFVAPTKALVNQVAAQVYKDFEAAAGVFTRDYRHNVEGCRILVTVPACLEILLLSPSNQAWARRIRYAILDEVHCMREVHLGEGGVRDGAGSTWEHILLLLRCPFLALSATIGNPDEFAAWLAGVKRLQREQDEAAGRRWAMAGRRRYEVELIQHSVRHSDLRLHTYVPAALEAGSADGGGGEGSGGEFGFGGSGWQLPASDRVASLERLGARGSGGSTAAQPCGRLVRMNPLAVLEASDLQGSFPPELSLEPVDVEQLYDAMRAAVAEGHVSSSVGALTLGSQADDAGSAGAGAWHAQAAAQLEELAPELYFAGLAGGGANRGPFFTRQQVRQYEAALKQLLLGWAGGDAAEGRAAAAAALAAVCREYQTPPEHDVMLEDGAAMVGLVLDLLRAGRLPAIAFSFERKVCHMLAEAVVGYLEKCEAQEKVANYEHYRALRDSAEKAEKAGKAARDAKPDKRQGGEQAAEEPAGGGWDEDAVLPEFSLAGKPKRLSTSEVEGLIWETAAASGWGGDNPLVQGLRRGIGIHHGGLPKMYRQVVEILFRAGHLRFVIATGTLAFGIHMPCRTVVFAGDHLFLNSLQFRQMMGRAGRRGFDPLGHICFFGISQRKVRSLMISPVPHLLGHFPLTLTMCLRALALHHIVSSSPCGGAGSKKKGGSALVSAKGGGGGGIEPSALVRDTLAAMFQRPFYAEGQPRLLQQVRHLFSFAVAYLARAGAIGEHDEPIGLAGLLCHLHWTDPANLALTSVLRTGVLDEICKGAKPGMSPAAFEPIAEQLLTVFSHMFQCIPLHRALLADPERFLESPSKVVLEPLPPAVHAAISAHNQQALQLCVGYVRAYVAGLGGEGGEAEAALPLSGLRLPVVPDRVSAGAAPPDSLLGLLGVQRVRYAVCSPFAALSGVGDEFSSMDDLVRSVRSGVLLDVATLPTVGMADRHGRPVPLNRYALDYWKHGQKDALVAANGMREGDAWQALSAFTDILRIVSVALGQTLPPDSFHPVAHCMDRLAQEYKHKFAVFNAAAPGRRGGY